MIDETLPLSQHELIGAAECDAIARQVERLARCWTRRSGFYSLGAASYLDAVRGAASYLAAAQTTNKVLLEAFGGLYDRLWRFSASCWMRRCRSISSGLCRGFTYSC
jgi:hypothetical protein